MNNIEELHKNEESRINYVNQLLGEWTNLEQKIYRSFRSNVKGLKKERRDIIKYLGVVAGGAAALAPQLLNEIQQPSLFYVGVCSLSFVLVFSIIYILSNIENEANFLIKEFDEIREVIKKTKEPYISFLKEGSYDFNAFQNTIANRVGEGEVLKMELASENRLKKKNCWFKSLDYAGEFIVFFFIMGIALIAIGISDLKISYSQLIYFGFGIFVFINIISTFPNKPFQYLGLPIDALKTCIRWILKKPL